MGGRREELARVERMSNQILNEAMSCPEQPNDYIVELHFQLASTASSRLVIETGRSRRLMD